MKIIDRDLKLIGLFYYGVRYNQMNPMMKMWKRDMKDYIKSWFDPSLDEEENYNTITTEYERADDGFIDADKITKEQIIEIGGSTELANQVDMFDDLSGETQNEVWNEVEELIKDYGLHVMEAEEDWIREKICEMKTA